MLLVRFHALADRLIERELPALRSHVSCESAIEDRWMRSPSGGRVDALSTLRRAPAVIPDAWLVRHNLRLVDTPVNRWARAVIGQVQTLVEREHRRSHTWKLRRERAVLRRTGRALRNFLVSHPLGDVPDPGTPPNRLERMARRRRAAFRRLASLRAWWQEFSALDLDEVRGQTAEGTLEQRSVSDCYELGVALALLLHLRARWGATKDLVFRAPAGRVQAVLDEPLAGYAPPTLRLRAGEREVVIEARNTPGGDVTTQVLDLYQRAFENSTVVQVLPVAPPGDQVPAVSVSPMALWVDPLGAVETVVALAVAALGGNEG